MKFTKMSLVAALLIGSSAFAIDNVKVSGDAKLYYTTSDDTSAGVTAGTNANNVGVVNGSFSGSDDSLFTSANSAGQAALGLGVTADLVSGVSAGAHLTALSTLGLQGQLVGNVWEGTNGTNDTYWFDEAWLAATVGKTTLKAGRMALDTPYVFSETWSIAKNTFEAAVLINQDIPDTTLVGAYVGAGNGNTYLGLGNPLGNAQTAGIMNVIGAQDGNGENNFQTFYHGAYAAGLINNSFKPLTFQAWYFGATKAADAYWLQADLDASSLGAKGVLAGAQYTDINYLHQALGGTEDIDNDAYALMLGYEGMKDIATVKVAYSSTGTEKKLTGLGVGMNLAGTSQSKLYTEAWWNYGYVTRADTDAWNVTITSPVQGMFDLGLYYTSTTTGNNDNAGVADVDMDELAVTASKSFGPLDATLAYIYTNADDQNTRDTAGNLRNTDGTGDAYNTIQAYLTLNF